MNSVIKHCLRCIIHESGNMNECEKVLSIVELVINSLPNNSTGFSLFYLNDGHEPILPIQLIKGNEEIKTDSVVFLYEGLLLDGN